MQITNRALMLVGGALVLLGGLFLALNFVPGWSFGKAWPLIFFLIAGGFSVPVFMFPMYRQWIGALFIPGAIAFTLGLIFLYNAVFGDWKAWAYAWILLVAGVGLGLMLAASYSGWGRTVVDVGLWLLLVPLGLFALFGALFGSPQIKVAAPALLVIGGIALLARSVRRAPR